jgi:hypothetical protein
MSLSLVTACFETVPDTTCAGTDESVQWAASGYLTGLSLVEYQALGGGALFAPVNQLPLGALIFCKMSDGSICPGNVSSPGPGVYLVPPAVMTFGIASPYQPPFDMSQLSTVDIEESFAAGFLLVLGGFLVGAPIAALLRLIKS